MVKVSVPFNCATIVGRELEYIREAVESGIISGEGSFVKRCEQFISERITNKPEVLLTPSCTHALEMSALLLE